MEADKETGELLRDFGMKTVAENAPDEWRVAFQRKAEEWFSALSLGHVIIGEQLREALEPIIGQPHHANAWSSMAGHMVRRWKKDRRLRDHGTTTAKAKQAHARLVRQYLKVKD